MKWTNGGGMLECAGEEALQACEEWEKNVSICEERVRHQPTELYVTYAQSFKGGGFNNQRQTLQLAIVRRKHYMSWRDFD